MTAGTISSPTGMPPAPSSPGALASPHEESGRGGPIPTPTRIAIAKIWVCSVFAASIAIIAWASAFTAPLPVNWIDIPGGVWAASLSTIVAVSLKTVALGLRRGSGWARRLAIDFCWIALAAILCGSLIEQDLLMLIALLYPLVLLGLLLHRASRRWCTAEQASGA
ncbi:hypothetical protein [Natronoglycomyces albus]|uniref:Uncharacterized protein n=1 Tax=Natronoglycomyces albus TaxID=2811108 RepID=A0A895XMJ8_9ACTN|nr:hypothetical protein [Natronoglycomyces albus]QSB04235.1 hypothetical protein JQS30_10510 [Natronoglycomyces albus]